MRGHNDIVAAIEALRPGAQWSLDGDSLAGLAWIDTAQARPTDDEINAKVAELEAQPPGSFFARDLIAQLTAGDTSSIQGAVSASAGMALLWYSLLAQGDTPIAVASQRFKDGWAALTQVLGADRCAAIATALNIVPPAAG